MSDQKVFVLFMLHAKRSFGMLACTKHQIDPIC